MMDTIIQSPVRLPHFTLSGCPHIEGLPSPAISCCSEPIFLSPGLNHRSILSALQQKPPRIQHLNGKIEKSVRKNHAHRASKKPADVKKIQRYAAFPVVVSDGGFFDGSSKNLNGSRSSVNNTRYSVPKLKTTPFHYPFQYPHLESWRQIAYVQSKKEKSSTELKQTKQNGRSGFASAESLENNHRKRICRNLPVIKHPTQEADLPSSTLLKPKFFENGIAIMQKPGKLWKKQRRLKHKSLGKKKGKRSQRKSNLLHKTELCVHWTLTSICKFRDRCYFAHGIEELKNRVRPSNFKTRPCADCALKNRHCFYGPRCNFCHPGEGIRRDVGSAYFDREYYKDLAVHFKKNEYPFGIFV